MTLRIVFDENKRQANRDKHGCDFLDLDRAFFDDAELFEAKKGRLMAIGWLDNRVVTVVFETLGTEALSVVSMRPASRKERSLI